MIGGDGHRPPDLFLASDGRVFVSYVLVTKAQRAGRRALRVVELTSGEAAEVKRRVADMAFNVTVGLLGGLKGGAA